MATNKAKILENAQKYLSAGKIPQAITEYLQILRQEPNDQITLMTVGDLYVRAGDVKQSLEHFEKLAQLFISDGFISKSIAIYKKISKLAPDELHPLEKLSELYVQQGVMSEARPIYLQMAEIHLKANRSPQAIEVLRKLLDLEPDNQRVQIRLGELYQTINQPKEAATAFLNAAQKLLEKGTFAEALKFADRAHKADPKNAKIVLVKARVMAGQGHAGEAVTLLEAIPPAERSTETTGLLVEMYLKDGQSAKAVEMAKQAFQWGPENYPMVCDVAAGLLDGGETDSAIALLGEVRDAMIEANDLEKLAGVLSTAADRAHGRLEPHEWLVELYRRSGDQFRLPEALNAYGEAAVAAGNMKAADTAFEELHKLNPEDEAIRQKLNQVRSRLGMGEVAAGTAAAPPVPPSQEIPTAFADEVAAGPAIVEEAPLDEETQAYVNQALTDVDLFSGYGLAQKAIDLLESVLKRAPRHTGVLEKLLDTYLGAGNERRTSEIAGQLEQIYASRGDTANADRFAQLRRRFQRAAGLAEEAPPPAPPPAEFSIPTATAEPAGFEEIPLEIEATPAAAPEVAAAPEGDSTVQEVDLSSEWAEMASQTTEAPAPVEAKPEPPPPAPAPVETQPEAFEVSLEESWDAGEKKEAELAPAEPPAPAPAPVEAAADESVEIELTEEQAAPAPAAQEEAQDFELQASPETEVKAASPDSNISSDQFLSDLASEIDNLDFGTKAPTPPPGKKAPAAPAAGAKGQSDSHLSEVFEEFRSELGEMGEEVEDLETHYNLGIAYREMGLLEEAIGEFQKVAKMIQGGRPFRSAMQCFTLLALTFMDKGQPTIAVMWYQKALEIKDLDQESVMALRYDLGISQEQAGDVKAAMQSFSQVYAMNIDYRDVAERIAALQKKA